MRKSALPLVVIAALLSATPVAAQFSDSYKFLEAIRKKDGQKVTDALAEPGSTLINTRDITTGETALHIVTKRRDLTWMQFLIAKGANVNMRDAKGVTPLVVAANVGFVEGLELLVSKGARLDEANNAGETPLITAVHNRNAEMMRILLRGGADPNRADNSGRSARDYALLDGGPAGVLAGIIDREAKAKGGDKAKSYGPKF